VWLGRRHYGFGATIMAFYVGNSSDGGANGELQRGLHVVPFVEREVLSGWFTPYARFGLGAGVHTRWVDPGLKESGLGLVAALEFGAAAKLGPVVIRALAGPAFFGRDFLLVYGAQIGGRFPTY
jgi:hypothetical protein